MRRLLPPLLALACARTVTAGAAVWAGVDPLTGAAWERWDSGLYLSIAHNGYLLHPCPDEPAAWCGNAGWFPLYPWLLRLANGALLSLVFEAALLAALWFWFLRERGLPALLLAALFPGCIYQQAVFPISLALLCALCFVAACERERYALAAVAGALAALTYPTGFLLAPVALAWRWRKPWPALGVMLGFLAVLAVLQLQTGHWDGYFLVQERYRFGFAPLDTLFSRLKPLVNARFRDARTLAAGLQTLLVLVTMALSLRAFRADRLLALYGLAYWAFPLCVGGRLSLHRAEALLLPMVPLVPPRARVPLLCAAVPIAFAVSVAFFRGTLV